MPGPQATGADFYSLRNPIRGKGELVNVGHKPGLGAPFGVAHVVARHPDLAAYFALHRLTDPIAFCKIQQVRIP